MSNKSFIDDVLIEEVKKELQKDLGQLRNYWIAHPICSEIRFNGRLLFSPERGIWEHQSRGLFDLLELREIQPPKESYITNFNAIVERYINKKAREKAEELVNKINTEGE